MGTVCCISVPKQCLSGYAYTREGGSHVVVCPVQSWLCIRFVVCAISHILNYFN